MPFNPIDSSETESGKPITTTLVGKIQDNFDDHEERLQVIESGTATTYPPLIFTVKGNYAVHGAVTNVLKTTLNFSILLTGVRILIDQAGASGTTEIDLKYKRGGGSYISLMTTKPSVGFAAGDDALSSNGVLNPSLSTLLAGDILRLDITSVQTNGSRGFQVRIDYSGA